MIHSTQQKPIFNTRLLCLEACGIPISWESQLAGLKQYVETSPKLQQARGDALAHLFFLAPPIDPPRPQKMKSLLGLEVIGHELFGSESPYRLVDLDQGSCYGLQTLLSHPSRSQIFTLAAKKFKESSSLVAKPWRLLYTKRGVDIQFFNKIYSDMLLKGLEGLRRGHYSK